MSASKTFFGKELDSLTPGEALALAVIPRSPEKYNPFNGIQELRNKTFELSRRIGFDISKEEIEKDLTESKLYIWENNANHFINIY